MCKRKTLPPRPDVYIIYSIKLHDVPDAGAGKPWAEQKKARVRVPRCVPTTGYAYRGLRERSKELNGKKIEEMDGEAGDRHAYMIRAGG